MTVLSDYNIIKEGDIYNVYVDTTLHRVELTPSELRSLYDGSIISSATTVSGTAVSGTQVILEVNWGESFDVNKVKYYHDEASSSGISIWKGVSSGNEESINFTTAAGISESSIVGDARYIRIYHEVSHGVITNVNQLVIEGVRNDSIGFGESASDEVTNLLVDNSPIGYESSSYTAVPVYNDYNLSIDIKLSVAPTGSISDSYVLLATTPSGEYYGINDYGFLVPVSIALDVENDSFTGYSNFVSFNEDSKWDIIQGAMQSVVRPTSDGLLIDVSGHYFSGTGNASASTIFGIISKEKFTGNQSFTMKMKVKLGAAVLYFPDQMEAVFGFTNNMPIPCSSYNSDYPYLDETNTSRAGRSGVMLVASFDDSYYGFVYGDGNLKQDGRFVDGFEDSVWNHTTTVSNDDLGEIVDGDSSNNKDWTSDASFREWVFTWDHINRVATGYIDGLKIGERRFSNPPLEGCKLYFLIRNARQFSVTATIKDFEIDTTRIYKQRNLNLTDVLSSTAYDSSDPTYHGASNLTDGTDLEWVGGYTISSNDWAKVSLSTPKDIVSFSFKNPPYGGAGQGPYVTNISGSYTKSFKYVPKNFFVAIDEDLDNLVLYNADATYNVENKKIFNDVNGSTTVHSGTSSVTFYFTDFHEASGRDPETDIDIYGSIALREIGMVEQYYETISVFPDFSKTGHFSWDRGLLNRIKQTGANGYFELDNMDAVEFAVAGDSEMLIKGVNYDTTNSPYQSQLIYKSTHVGQATDYNNWNFYVPIAFWRRFENFINVRGFYTEWNLRAATPGYHAIFNKFKFQSLIRGLDPALEGSWADIPPIENPYVGSNPDYTDYVQYFIDNNDGEYYTNIAELYAQLGDLGGDWSAITIPSDTVLKKDFRWSGVNLFNGLACNMYIEFDSDVYTDAIRMIVLEVKEQDMTGLASQMNMDTVGIFSSTTIGSYISPVFDTKTELNTERVFGSLEDMSTSSGVISYRSSDSIPVYKEDYEYLTWQPWQIPGKGTKYDFVTGTASMLSGYGWPYIGVVDGTKVYLMGSDSSDDNFLYYDYATNLWGIMAPMSDVGDDIVVDGNIRNNGVVLDDGIMYVAVREGNQNSKRILKYNISANTYGITGWERLPNVRPPEIDYSGMVGYGNSLYFFGDAGDVIEFNMSTGIWDSGLASMPMRGQTYRRYFFPCLVGSKVYIFGGNSQFYSGSGAVRALTVEVYDIENDSWEENPAELNYSPGMSCYAFNYGSDVVVLPANNNSTFGHEIPSVYNTTTNTVTEDYVLSLLSGNYYGDGAVNWDFGLSWVYGDYIYTTGYADNGDGTWRRVKIKKESWESGYLSSRYDSTWGSSSLFNSSWIETSVSGETIAQDRYVQFKVQLMPSSDEYSSLIKKVGLIVPQTMENVPTSGTEDFYLKLGISSDYNYEFWFSDAQYYSSLRYAGWNVIYTGSTDGYTINDSTLAVSSTVSGSDRYGYRNPYVLKEGLNSYKMWTTGGITPDGLPTDSIAPFYDVLSSGTIQYSTSSDGREWASFSEVISLGTEGTYDTHSSRDCCIIKISVNDYKMWYTGRELSSSTDRIIYCDSVDGITWSNFSLSHDINTSGLPGQADVNGAYAPFVLWSAENGYYTMWYTGVGLTSKHSIIRCVSTDGLSWSSHAIVLQYGKHGIYDIKGAAFPFIIFEVSLYKMWYVGLDEEDEQTILYVTSSDGIIWDAPVVTIARGFGSTTSVGVERASVTSNSSFVVPNTYFNDAKIKIYNG
jgi:hypothetical protein